MKKYSVFILIALSLFLTACASDKKAIEQPEDLNPAKDQEIGYDKNGVNDPDNQDTLKGIEEDVDEVVSCTDNEIGCDLSGVNSEDHDGVFEEVVPDNTTTFLPEYEPSTIYIDGKVMPYVFTHSNNNLAFHNGVDDNTWITAGSYYEFDPDDGKGTFFIAPKFNALEMRKNLHTGYQIYITDQDANPYLYEVEAIYGPDEIISNALMSGELDKEYIILRITTKDGFKHNDHHVVANRVE